MRHVDLAAANLLARLEECEHVLDDLVFVRGSLRFGVSASGPWSTMYCLHKPSHTCTASVSGTK
eukprot:5623512-Prymnesium_polylepis.1